GGAAGPLRHDLQVHGALRVPRHGAPAPAGGVAGHPARTRPRGSGARAAGRGGRRRRTRPGRGGSAGSGHGARGPAAGGFRVSPGNPSPVRVQKYISQAGVASRRQAEVMLGEGRIAINGVRVTSPGARVLPGSDTVSVDGRIVQPAPRRWVVFHKPAGVLCTRTDPHGGETIYDLLPGWAGGLRYVGRLDRDTSGLLLLTNDGDLASRIAHPSGRVEREYLAGVAGKVTAGSLRRLRRGVMLEDGPARPKRVRRVELDDGEWGVRLVLAEGRKREVRRMLKAVGHPVRTLVRTRFGPFRLGGLPPGGWRPARTSELDTVRSAVMPSGRRAQRSGTVRA
ncbi:MAG: rRNA pseudouridine synthase, partial [Gemmatimonadetes bacterium]|nr:rRNA pseudouridine synthase [Gemmatimonadota bacterium]MYK67902.1 rRNA pseudouridine synthase [Gemmatimonadota bacterium]